MRRYWISEDKLDVNQDKAYLDKDLFHHVVVVCRRNVGDHFELLNKGQAYLVELVSKSKNFAEAKILETRELPALRKPYLHLCLSLPRYPKIDEVIEKSVELGVSALHPFVSENSFIRKTAKLPEKKWERWHKIIKSASQQSARGELMRLHPVKTLSQVLEDFNQTPQALGLFPYEGSAAVDLKNHLRSLLTQDINEIWYFVGSEGGFTEKEAELFGKNGLKSLTLGDQVLRVETACVALAAILKYEFGLMTP